ncbi:MAG: four helix bundle protein [Chitinophagaceae bacterium]|nr:four helix bundle protein [Chitinophagaceae bacterium]
MFLALKHTGFEVYIHAGEIVVECYRLSKLLPSDEKFNLVGQIRRAAISIKLNIAEGASRRTTAERKRFYEIARSSLVELDSAFDVCVAINYYDNTQLVKLSKLVNSCYAMLSKLISN